MQKPYEKIRRAIVTALFADDDLFDHLVLKGGNALRLVHGIGGRTSLDLDFSVEGDLESIAQLEELQRRMLRSLQDRLETIGYIPFDVSLERRPRRPKEPRERWGGYELRLKVISRAEFERFDGDLYELQRRAEVTGPQQHRDFKVQISKYEYCGAKVAATLDAFQIQVYTPSMIAIEKVRAICQQFPEYPYTIHRRARARDFYDIYTVVTEGGVQLASAEHLELFRAIFSAKQVSLELIPRISETREFHRPDWSNVEIATARALEPFDTYFDFVVNETRPLEALWDG